MNKKKRRVAVLLSATIGSAVLVLSGCSGKSDQTEKTLRVGVITYTQDDPFINGLTDELKAQLKAMENNEGLSYRQKAETTISRNRTKRWKR